MTLSGMEWTHVLDILGPPMGHQMDLAQASSGSLEGGCVWILPTQLGQERSLGLVTLQEKSGPLNLES
jgi:hypothetical protein